MYPIKTICFRCFWYYKREGKFLILVRTKKKMIFILNIFIIPMTNKIIFDIMAITEVIIDNTVCNFLRIKWKFLQLSYINRKCTKRQQKIYLTDNLMHHQVIVIILLRNCHWRKNVLSLPVTYYYIMLQLSILSGNESYV